MRSKADVSYNMSKIRCKDTKIEVILRKELWARGIRYRKNDKTVYGKPDITIKKFKIAIFCDSEFWHGYDWEKHKDDFKSNKDFWMNKITRNMERDKEVNSNLTGNGWMVLRFWGKKILKETKACADEIEDAIKMRKKAI